LARDHNPLEHMVRLNLLFHLLLNLWEILRRDAMRELDIIIKAVLNRRPGRELRLGPQPQHGGRHHMSARMPDAFQLGHLFTILHKKLLTTDIHRCTQIETEISKVLDPREAKLAWSR